MHESGRSAPAWLASWQRPLQCCVGRDHLSRNQSWPMLKCAAERCVCVPKSCQRHSTTAQAVGFSFEVRSWNCAFKCALIGREKMTAQRLCARMSQVYGPKIEHYAELGLIVVDGLRKFRCTRDSERYRFVAGHGDRTASSVVRKWDFSQGKASIGGWLRQESLSSEGHQGFALPRSLLPSPGTISTCSIWRGASQASM